MYIVDDAVRMHAAIAAPPATAGVAAAPVTVAVTWSRSAYALPAQKGAHECGVLMGWWVRRAMLGGGGPPVSVDDTDSYRATMTVELVSGTK